MKYLLLLLLSADVYSQQAQYFPVRYYTKGDSIGVSLDFGINWYHKKKVPSEFILKYHLGEATKSVLKFPGGSIYVKPPKEAAIEFDGNYCYRTKNGKREKIPCAPLYAGKDTFPELKEYNNAGPAYTYTLPVHRVRNICYDRHRYERCASLSIGMLSDGSIPIEYSGIKKRSHKWVELHQDTVDANQYYCSQNAELRKIGEYIGKSDCIVESVPLICLICHQEKKKIIHYKRKK